MPTRDEVIAAAYAGLDRHIHLLPIGAGKDIGRRTLAKLLGQLLRTGKVKDHLDAGIRGLEIFTDFVKRIGQRSGGKNGERGR